VINFGVRGQGYNKRQISNGRQTRIIAGCWDVHRTVTELPCFTSSLFRIGRPTGI